MNRLFWLVLLLLSSKMVSAQQLKVGLMRRYTISALELGPGSGKYAVYGDTTLNTVIKVGQELRFKRSGDKVKIIRGDKTLGYFDTVVVKACATENFMKVQVVAPSVKKTKKYHGNFLIVPEAKTTLKLINEIDVEEYLPGVIESEGGGGKHLEYYKVQAILSRTYALAHLNKHKKEGFNLCSDVHCQAYHNMERFTPSIVEAVKATKGLVMIDEFLNLAHGFFFANCGGQTSEADFVWNEPVSYCRSVRDTFCTRSWQANWMKKINKDSWRNFLRDHFGFPENHSVFKEGLYSFSQAQRHAFYLSPTLGIPLRDLRVHFKLKSTWFNVHLEGDQVVLEGKGFGHGVGLCQEGAMRMANLNFSAVQILRFYFTGVSLTPYRYWSFMRQINRVVTVL